MLPLPCVTSFSMLQVANTKLKMAELEEELLSLRQRK
jgi:hypothetical protein